MDFTADVWISDSKSNAERKPLRVAWGKGSDFFFCDFCIFARLTYELKTKTIL
jgi:hypothetical protein